jgi:protein involved in polysaccharide export with SLBB domain
MKKIAYQLLIFFLFSSIALAQSQSDIEKLLELKKRMENMDLSEPDKKEAKTIESLETFYDKTDSLKLVEDLIDPKSSPLKPIEKQEFDFTTLIQFGHDIFKTANIDFDPEIYGPVDELYPIGPGDNLVITVWGEVELRHDLTVSRQGQIYIPEVGLTNVAGLTVAQLKKKLKNLLGKSYSSLLQEEAFLDVSLGKLRSIRVYVMGDVQTPGVYTVPAIMPVFNMLFYAGGVTKTGSLRKISVIRRDRVHATLDFYDFLTSGIKFSGIRLQNDDVVLVSTVTKQVYLAGSVKKEAIYELLSDEGLSDLIKFSGGFRDSAYTDHIQIERIVNNKDRKIIDIHSLELGQQDKTVNLENGDRIFIGSIDRKVKNYLDIEGPIYGPRRFEYIYGMTLGDLISKVDSIRGDAYLDRVQITRRLPDQKSQIFSVSLTAILEGTQSDLLLAPEDQIKIHSKDTLFPPDSVLIHGAVNNQGTYLLKKSMTLKDLIFAADGFRKDALIEQAEISRIDPLKTNRTELAQIIYVNIDPDYTTNSKQEDEVFFLQPYDNIFIRQNSDWELQRNVFISGEIRFPGKYTLQNKTERITDLIQRAGGLKPTAYLEGATLIRNKKDIGQIGIDFNKIFEDPDLEENIYLQADDQITIPERLYTVIIDGGVNVPGSVYYEDGEALDYYINAAGGYTELADEDNVLIRLANGKPVQQSRFLFWKSLSEDINPGSTIYVPVLQKKDSIDWSSTFRDTAAILGSIAALILIVDQLNR